MVEDDPEEFDTSGSFSVDEWLALWSYEKIHATIYGFVYAFLAATLSSGYILSVGAAVLLWALGIRSSPHRVTKTGDKKPEHVKERTRDGKAYGLSAQLLAEIRHKPHYFLGGAVAGDRVGWLVHYWLYGVGPDHYEKIPQIAEAIITIA